MKTRRSNKLPLLTRLILFVSSYVPLFVIIVLKQVLEHQQYLHFGGFSPQAVTTFFEKFLVSALLLPISLAGIVGLVFFTTSMKIRLERSGDRIEIKKIQNKNNESIGYVATYLVPFMYQSFSTPFEVLSFLILMTVVFVIYVNSTLLVVNPMLNLWYSLYDIEYVELKSGLERSGTFIITQHNIRRSDRLVVKDMGNNTFFSRLEESDE